MAVKIYTSGNQFIMEFDGKPEPIEGAKANVNVQLVDDPTKTFLIESENVGSHKIKLADMQTQAGAPYDFASFTTFYRANTGFNPAPGGSGVASVTGTGVDNTDPSNPIVDRVVGEGRVKVNGSGGGVKPTFALVANVETIVDYGAAVLDLSSSPTNEWPQNIGAPNDKLIFEPTTKTFVENLILGQTHTWRVVFDYSGKNNNDVAGLEVIMRNTLSGFETKQTLALPEGRTADSNQQAVLITIADQASLPAPFGTGVGYQLSFKSNKVLNIVVQHVTRISQFHNKR